MNKRFFRIQVDDFNKDKDGNTIVSISVVDTRNGNVIIKSDRIVELDISDDDKKKIEDEVNELLLKINERKLD